ncbi:MAG TPA: hypothetical protein DD827_05540 [Gammaproteobacteria bacterium]|nr:hypothetical protein [Gammaproteobacteria bacterium]
MKQVDPYPILSNPNLGDQPPFHRMAADAFEEMCCALLSKEADIKSADLFGRPREPQFGIDIIGLHDGDSADVISCKCYTNLRKGHLARWSTDFLDHWETQWGMKKIQKFVLAVAADIKSTARQKEIEVEKARFAKVDVKYEVWPPRLLQEKLRLHPGLIAQFIGLEWVSRLCGISNFSWERPKDLLEKRWSCSKAGDFEKAADYADRAARNAKAVNNKKSLANALRCSARDLGDYLLSKHLVDAERDKIISRIALQINELETLDLPDAEIALEKALFARLDKRPHDARRYAEIAETKADKPETAADALLVQLQAYWQLDKPKEALSLKDRVQAVVAEVNEGDAALALQANWLRTLSKNGNATLPDIEGFLMSIQASITNDRTTYARALLFIQEVSSEFDRAKDFSNALSLMELAVELATKEPDTLLAANITLQIAQIEAELGNEATARKHIGLAEKWIDAMKSNKVKKTFWASRKATFLVMRSRIETITASKVKSSDYSYSVACRKAAYEELINALGFIRTHESELQGEIGPFIADVELRSGFAASALGKHLSAAAHFHNVRTDRMIGDNKFHEMVMKAWIGEAESLLFGGKPAESRAVWKQISASSLADGRQRDGARHNIRWINEHVLEVIDWSASDACSELRTSVLAEPEGLRKTISKQVEPLVEWFSQFPSKDGKNHAYSELFDIWGRGGFSRIVAAVRADPLNAICVDAQSINEIALFARVFCPLYDTVIVIWKGEIHPALGLVPMPDNIGPPGEFGGQGYIRTSDTIDGKDGWHAAMGWANYLPREISEFLAIDALPLVRSGRLVLLPAPLVGCTQNDVGWTDNLLVDSLLGGVVKSGSHSTNTVSGSASGSASRLVDLSAVNIPFIDGVSLSDLNHILNDSGDWLQSLRQPIRRTIASNGLRGERWDELKPYLADVRDAFRELDEHWKNLAKQHSGQTSWRTAALEGAFSAMKQPDDMVGFDPITSQLQAIATANDNLGPWMPMWRLRKAGGKINWSASFDNTSIQPDLMAKMQGFTSSVSQGWLYPGDGGPGMGASIRIGVD